MNQPVSILVVDDNLPVIKTLKDILEAKSYRVFTASTGNEVLKIMKKEFINILLTDIKMPDMNGVELYQKLQKINKRPATILMTAYAADDIIKEGLDIGIKTVLTKPLDIDLLLNLIEVLSDPLNTDNSWEMWPW